ncbi:hypothetical protein FKM82_030037 [Ascaphus truei]
MIVNPYQGNGGLLSDEWDAVPFPPAPESMKAAVEVRKVGPERVTGIVSLFGNSLLGGRQEELVPRESPFLRTLCGRLPGHRGQLRIRCSGDPQ